jgi:acetyl-CoA carboxylase biotin carboxyl carrier protein
MRAKDIRELVKIVEESNIGELEVTRWGQKIRISKTALSNGSQNADVIVAAQPQQVAAPQPVAETPAAPVKEKSNLIEIKAPMVGTFYRSPAPDADAYVREGDSISNGKILCIIEAMKLMNEIESENSGKIVQILVENAQPVEYDQPLFLVEPS